MAYCSVPHHFSCPWISQTYLLLPLNGWLLRVESRSHDYLWARQLYSLHTATHFFQFLFQMPRWLYHIPLLETFYFLVALEYNIHSVPSATRLLFYAIFAHYIRLSSHINFISVYGLPWPLLPLGLSPSCCLWWNILPASCCFSWPFPLPASSLDLAIISSKKPFPVFLEWIRWLCCEFLQHPELITVCCLVCAI